jgi:hypothetical protein
MLRRFFLPSSWLLAGLSAAGISLVGCNRHAYTPSSGVESAHPRAAAKQASQGPVAASATAGALGEDVLPADKAPYDAPLRPMDGLPLYRLTDLRIGNPGPGPSPKLMVHYERLNGEEPGSGPTLVIRTPDGNEHPTLGIFGPFQGQKKAGDFVVDLGFRGAPGSGGSPQDLEVYLIQNDRRWEGEDFHPKFKVSNSVVLGNMGRPPQFAREWKPEEQAKLNNPPPVAPKVNANVGEDTEFIGQTEGLLPALRYADPAKRPVIGVLYSVGQGEPEKGQKVNCLVHLTPAYDARQPRYNQEAVFAKPGYAVGALLVKTKKIVTAVQAVFMKQKPDGTLDSHDSYTSKWLGHPEAGDKEGKIGGDGRKVIGMHLKHFGVLYAVALVLE